MPENGGDNPRSLFHNIRRLIGRQEASTTPYFDVQYKIDESGLPHKHIIRNGLTIKDLVTAEPHYPRQYIPSHEAPPMSKGRTYYLTDAGTYKEIFVDEADNSQVIKRYRRAYKPHEKDYAEKIAANMRRMYAIINEIIPGYIPKNEILVAPYSTSDTSLSIYEIQDRAIPVDPWLIFEPDVAQRFDEEAEAAKNKFITEVLPRFRTEKLIPTPTETSDPLLAVSSKSRAHDFTPGFLPNIYDMQSNRLIALDIIDQITIDTAGA